MYKLGLILIFIVNIYASKFIVDSVTIKNTRDTFNVSITDTLTPVIIKDYNNNSVSISCFNTITILNVVEKLFFEDSTYAFLNRDTLGNGATENMILFKTIPGDTIETWAYGYWVNDKSEFATIYQILDTTAITNRGTILFTFSQRSYRPARAEVWRKPTVTINNGVTTLPIYYGQTPLDNPQGSTSGRITLQNLLPLLPGTYYLLSITNRSGSASSFVTFYINWTEISPELCPF